MLLCANLELEGVEQNMFTNMSYEINDDRLSEVMQNLYQKFPDLRDAISDVKEFYHAIRLRQVSDVELHGVIGLALEMHQKYWRDPIHAVVNQIFYAIEQDNAAIPRVTLDMLEGSFASPHDVSMVGSMRTVLGVNGLKLSEPRMRKIIELGDGLRGELSSLDTLDVLRDIREEHRRTKVRDFAFELRKEFKEITLGQLHDVMRVYKVLKDKGFKSEKIFSAVRSVLREDREVSVDNIKRTIKSQKDTSPSSKKFTVGNVDIL